MPRASEGTPFCGISFRESEVGIFPEIYRQRFGKPGHILGLAELGRQLDGSVPPPCSPAKRVVKPDLLYLFLKKFALVASNY